MQPGTTQAHGITEQTPSPASSAQRRGATSPCSGSSVASVRPSWQDPKKLVTIDPWGHLTTSAFKDYLDKGYDIRPTIAVTKAHIDLLFA